MLLFAMARGKLFHLMVSLTLWDAGGFIASKETLMVPFKGLKHVLLLKAFTSVLEWTIMRPSVPLLSQQLFVWCLVLLSTEDGLLNSWTSIMPSFKVAYLKQCTWRNHLGLLIVTIPHLSANSTKPFMGLNKRLGPSTMNCANFCWLLGFAIPTLILLCLFLTVLNIFYIYWFMWMT